jgi:UDP-glucuronate decarboxylase
MHPSDGRVVSNFIMCALKNEPILVYGDGCQTRSFCYVDDLINGLTRLMAAPDECWSAVNLGNPAEITVKHLAEKIIAITGSRSEIRYVPLPQDDPRQRCPDIGRARELLAWQPLVPLETGLKRTIAYFEAMLGMAKQKPRRRRKLLEQAA